MTYNLNLLRAIGIFLVTNSHFDALYPDPRLGTGGGSAMRFSSLCPVTGWLSATATAGAVFWGGTGGASRGFFPPSGLLPC